MRLMRSSLVAVALGFVAAGCLGSAPGTATITGTLVGADGACLYVHVPHANGTDVYWLRNLPPGYVADEYGLGTPDGSLIEMGDSLTVSGALSWEPFDRRCAGAHTLDATAVK